MSKVISKIVVPDSSELTGYALYNVKDANAIPASEKGAASGVATLDNTGKIPSSQIPSGIISLQSDWNQIDSTAGDYIKNKPASMPASDVSSWAKKSTKPSYTKSEVGLGNVGNFLAVSTEASQGLSETQKTNARSNIGAGTSSFSGSYDDLSDKPTIPAAANNGTYTVKTLVGSTTTNVSDFTANQSGTDDVTFVQGSNVTITPDATNRKITIAAKDTTYSSKAAASGGTDVSLVTTGEKHTWNSKTSNTGTVTKVTAGTGLTGGDITTTGTIALATSGVTAGTYKRVTVDAYGRVTSGDNTDNNTTYTFAGGTNKFTVTPSGGSAQDVTVTPSISNNVTANGNFAANAIVVGNAANQVAKNSGVTISTAAPSSSSADTTVPTSKAVWSAIDALPEPMVFKGSLGTGGTITALPVNGTATIGDTYKVITAGTYANQAAKIGDVFICSAKTSNSNSWTYIPSADEPSGTVTSVKIAAGTGLSVNDANAITTSGTRTISLSSASQTSLGKADTAIQTITAAAGSNIGSVGTPSVTASTSNNATTLTFNYLKGTKGDKGDKGDTGTTPTIAAAAGTNIGTVGTPSVTASTSGTKTTFTFNYLKGAKGDPGQNATTTAVVSTSANGLAPKVTDTSKFLKGDGTWAVPNSDFVKSGSSAAHGLVPAPPTTAGTTKYLREDGTWLVPPDTNTTYSAATTSAAGLMSATDKTKLNGIAAGAEVNVQSDWNAESGDAFIKNKPTIPSVVQTTGQSTTAVMSQKAVSDLVPAQASLNNQLADKDFVNSSITTATATYLGSYNLVSDLGLTISASHGQIEQALNTHATGANNNDYAFVQIPTSDSTPTEIASVERYKHNGTTWSYEYAINNSGFTAAQWAAVNSNITSGLVAKLNQLSGNTLNSIANLFGMDASGNFQNISTTNLASVLGVHIGTSTEAAGALFYACINAGYNGNTYDVIELIAAFEFTGGTQALYAIHYTHASSDPIVNKLCGSGNIGGINNTGTVANASKTTVYVLYAHRK